MWITSKHGFYSVVQIRTDKNLLMVRARVRGDLEKLLEISGQVERNCPEIISTPENDYPFRIIVARDLWENTLAPSLYKDIDYPNFKNTITDGERHRIYSAAWAVYRQLQYRAQGYWQSLLDDD